MLQKFPVSDECSAQRSRAGWETGAAHSSLRELQDTAHGATAGATGSCSFPLPFPHPTSLPYCKDSRWPARSHISLNSSYRNLFFNGNDGYQNSPHFCFPTLLPTCFCLSWCYCPLLLSLQQCMETAGNRVPYLQSSLPALVIHREKLWILQFRSRFGGSKFHWLQLAVTPFPSHACFSVPVPLWAGCSVLGALGGAPSAHKKHGRESSRLSVIPYLRSSDTASSFFMLSHLQNPMHVFTQQITWASLCPFTHPVVLWRWVRTSYSLWSYKSHMDMTSFFSVLLFAQTALDQYSL